MNKVLSTVSLCVAILALAFAIVPRTPEPVPSLLPPDDGPTDQEVTDLRRRIDQLETDNRNLWARVLSSEPRRDFALSLDAGSQALAHQVEQLRQEVQGEMLSNDAARNAMKDLIREAGAERAREQFSAVQARQQQRAEKQKEKWQSFISTARLTSQQEQRLTERLVAEDQARKALSVLEMDDAREGYQALRNQQRETDRLVLPTLDETQKAQYQALRREERGYGGSGNDSNSANPNRQPTP